MDICLLTADLPSISLKSFLSSTLSLIPNVKDQVYWFQLKKS